MLITTSAVSSLVFFNWPTIEIGVGLLASNLPHLSFRLGRAIKQSLPRALCVAIDSLRQTSEQHHHHPYDQPHAGPEAREGKSESRQGLRPGTGREKWPEAEGAKVSPAQNSSWSMEVVELRDMGPRRTGDDAV